MTDDQQRRSVIRVIDDDEAVRDAMSVMLSAKGWRVRCYDSAESFLSQDLMRYPGCLLLDIRMPGKSGLELQNELSLRGSPLPIIIITGHATVESAVATFRQGALDFLQKPVDPARLIEAIASACEISLCESDGALTRDQLRAALGELSERESSILRLLAQGLPNRVIEERLGISLRTVQGHRNNIYRKLRVHDGTQLRQALARIGP